MAEHGPSINGSILTPSTLPGVETTWNALVGDSGCGVIVADARSSFLFVNESAACLLGTTPGAAAGKAFADFFETAMAEERTAFVADAAAHGRVLVVDGMIRGRWTRCTHRAYRTATGAAVMMVLSTNGAAAAPGTNGDADVVHAREQDAGTLAVLTAREIEILRLIGDGLSTAEIAAELHRSVKTVEWHRVSLGSKLGQSNRVGLARLAFMAGLTRRDVAAHDDR